MRALSILAIALAVAVPLSSTSAQEMYSWKDRKGVTQYSDTPPTAGKYDTHPMAKDRAPTADTGKPASTAATGTSAQGTDGKSAQEDARCASTRQNLALLESKNSIQMAGSDGKPGKLLDAEERSKHLELAQASMKAYNCKPIAAANKR